MKMLRTVVQAGSVGLILLLGLIGFTAITIGKIGKEVSSPLRIFGLLALVTVVGGGTVVMAQACSEPANASARVVAKGADLYQDECASCHGETGERLPVAPLDSKEFLSSRGDATLMAVISEGKGIMPAFGEARGGPFEDADVRALVAFLNDRVGRQSTGALAELGRSLFAENCATCHGPRGDRIPLAPLNARGFLDGKSDFALRQAIETGKGPMPAFSTELGGRLTDNDIAAIIASLRYQVEEQTAAAAGRGRDIYVGNCLQCHGVAGDRIPGSDLTASGYLKSLGDGAILSAISGGKGVMPGFGVNSGGTMGVPDIAALLTYLKTWSGLNATSALALTSASGLGEDLFLQNCTSCHGQEGDGVPGIHLFSKTFLERETDTVLLQTIIRGNAKGMPAWGIEAGGPLTLQQTQSILDYLKSVAAQTEDNSADSNLSSSAGENSGTKVSLTAEAVAHGEEIFMGTCIMCHGQTRDLIPTCKLTDGDWLLDRGDETLIQSITFGKGAMPSWGQAKGGPLSPSDVRDVVAFLRNAAGVGEITEEPLAAPVAESDDGSLTATLSAQGKEIFMGTCAMCHGETRDKVPTCQLANSDWLSEKTFDGVIAAITNGKPPMMPAWGESSGGPLNAAEIEAVATFVWTEAGLPKKAP